MPDGRGLAGLPPTSGLPDVSNVGLNGVRPGGLAAGETLGREAGAPTAALRVLALGVNWFGAGSGGLDRVFHDLTEALLAAGIDLRGLVLGPADAAALSDGKVAAFGREGARLPERLWRARRAMAAALGGPEAPGLVAAHFAMFAFPALDLLRRRKLVVHFHGPWADEAAAEGVGPAGQALRWRMENAVYCAAGRVITLSDAFARLVVERYGVAPQRVRVVPGSVDLPRFAPEGSRAAARARAQGLLGWEAGSVVLLAVRRLVRRMGLDALIEAMPAILAERPDVRLVIAGRGPEEARLRALAARAGVAAQVRFQGFVPDALLPLAYRAADLNVVPSRTLEGFGLTAAEALASGTPSLVAPVGGLPEVVAGLSRALVLRGGAAGDIAAGVLAALGGGMPDDAACVEYAASRFAPALAAARVAAVYREAACSAL